MTRRARFPCVLYLALCALLLLMTLQTGWGGEEPPPTAPAPSDKSKELIIPEAEKNKKNPVPATPDSVESGKSLYASQCAMCHGGKGDGKGELVERLKMVVPDFTDPKVQKKRTDGEWFYLLSKGHADMPPENRLEANEKWDILNYLRSLSRGEKGQK